MGTVMCFIPLLFNLGEWAPGRRLYSPSEKGRERRGGVFKQGCLLAPLLFVLAVDTLTTCMSQACLHGILRGGSQMASYVEAIPQVQYADDIIFFMEGFVEVAWKLSKLSDLFADFLGL